MLNIVGSITMTIQPIYALFEKGDKSAEPQQLPQPRSANGAIETGTIASNDDATEIISDSFSARSASESP